MISAEQVKGRIRHYSDVHNLNSQEVLQIFLLERLLERISISKYASNFILKGGMLIASMIGVEERTTMDMDTTVQGLTMNVWDIVNVIHNIVEIDIGDNVRFKFDSIKEIRTVDKYPCYRVSLHTKFGKINSPLKLDITTGDAITPCAINYKYDLMLEERCISIMAYPIETVLAEKFETIISRNVANTRARDFYDLYVLYQQYREKIDKEQLSKAVFCTASRRNSLNQIKEWREILNDILRDIEMQNLWGNYVVNHQYASRYTFNEVLVAVEKVGTIVESCLE